MCYGANRFLLPFFTGLVVHRSKANADVGDAVPGSGDD